MAEAFDLQEECFRNLRNRDFKMFCKLNCRANPIGMFDYAKWHPQGSKLSESSRIYLKYWLINFLERRWASHYFYGAASFI